MRVVRGLLRRPLYASAVTLVLGIGLGGAYCLYGVVESVLFRPLEVAGAERLVRIFNSDERREERGNWSRGDVLQQLRTVEAFESVAFYADFVRLTYAEADRQHEWQGAIVSGNYFTTLGVNPLAGRLLQEADAVRGAEPVAVLSADTWRNRFNAHEGLIGQSIRINGRPVTIVGVAPAGFGGVSLETRPDVWLPMSLADMALSGFSLDMLYGRNVSWLEAVGRLAQGVSADDARQMLDTRRLARAEGEAELTPTLVLPAREVAIDPEGNRGTRKTSWVLLGLVGVLLLVVWSDTTGLMLLRAETQRAETAVRMSLGATRLRIGAETLAESGLLTIAAAALAAMTAIMLGKWLLGVAGADLGIAVDVYAMLFNPRSLGAFAAMSVLTVVLTTLVPMRRLARTLLTVVLRNAQADGSQRVVGVRDVLVAVQVGISLVLLTAAIAFVGSVRETLQIDPGFSVENRAVARISLNNQAGDDKQAYQEILQALRNDGRVKHAALTLFAPVQDASLNDDFLPQDYAPSPDEEMNVQLLPISDDFFETIGVELAAGRDIENRTGATGREVLVNRAFAERYWPNRSALGLEIYDLMSLDSGRVVGVVENYKQLGLHEAPRPMVFIGQHDILISGPEVVVEAATPELALAAIREVTRRVVPSASLTEPSTLQGRIDQLTARDRAIATVAAASAAFATLLAAVGMYGIAAFSMRYRQREIGIRYSLGATRANVVLRFLRRGALVASLGIAMGAVLTLLLAPRFAATIAGVDGHPLPELLLVTLLLAGVAILANVLPVWRAASVAPMEVLRDE